MCVREPEHLTIPASICTDYIDITSLHIPVFAAATIKLPTSTNTDKTLLIISILYCVCVCVFAMRLR